MSTVYLFRVDGSKDNDEFFAFLRPSASHVYAGVDFRVGTSGWIPDLIKIVIEEPPDRCSLTLIELEATESVALISCRKYLPENSTDILHAFTDYLDRLIRQCRSSADPRESEFARLKGLLSEVKQVIVTTAGALRSPARFIEELPLLDQPKLAAVPQRVEQDTREERRNFNGILRLSASQAKALTRCALVLDAVIRGFDHSATTFKIWRGQDRSQPLKVLLKKNRGIHPTLQVFILEKANCGLTLDFEMMLSELVEIWSSARNKALERERIRTLINRYYPVAYDIEAREQMPGIFEIARKHLSEEAI
jgi:hypothetical protein